MCYWVLGFKVQRGPPSIQLLFSLGRDRALDQTRDLNYQRWCYPTQ